MARKPAEFIGRGAGAATSDDFLEASDFKNDSVGIGKGMTVRTLHHHPVIRFGDRLTALAAKYISFLFRRWIGSMLFYDGRFAFFTRLVGGYTEKMNNTDCCKIH